MYVVSGEKVSLYSR